MEKIVIEGGKPLRGAVRVSGAKNAALPVIAACLLTGGWHRLRNIPRLRDITTITKIMMELGVSFRENHGVLEINSDNLVRHKAPYDLVKTMRASILLLGPLLARYGRATISLPGGCAIGARPVNLHLKALASMGADMYLEHGYINATAKRLKGAEIFLDTPTVTGTENLMMTAVTAEGTTVLKNAAREPEIVDLADMLRNMGADIEGDGTDTIRITGVRDLRPAEHAVIADRIEAGTFMIAAAMTGGDVTVEGCRAAHLGALVETVQRLNDGGAERLLCLGDLVGYGPHPNECVEYIAGLKNCTTLAGNHDWACCGRTGVEGFGKVAADSILWTRSLLSENSQRFLAGLPLTWRDSEMLAAHASPIDPARWRYIDNAHLAGAALHSMEGTICFIGHTHETAVARLKKGRVDFERGGSFTLERGCKYLVNVGSVGFLRRRSGQASYALFDRARATVEMYEIKTG